MIFIINKINNSLLVIFDIYRALFQISNLHKKKLNLSHFVGDLVKIFRSLNNQSAIPCAISIPDIVFFRRNGSYLSGIIQTLFIPPSPIERF